MANISEIEAIYKKYDSMNGDEIRNHVNTKHTISEIDKAIRENDKEKAQSLYSRKIQHICYKENRSVYERMRQIINAKNNSTS